MEGKEEEREGGRRSKSSKIFTSRGPGYWMKAVIYVIFPLVSNQL